MHWIEGLIMMAVGWVPWMIASGTFPPNYEQRQNLERAMPWVKNKYLMRGAAIFLWLLGGAALVSSYFGLSWRI